MRVSISYPVKSKHRIDGAWPIQLGDRSIFLTMEGGFLSSVSIAFDSVDVNLAPAIVQDNTREIKHSIVFRDSFLLRAERDLRAWQALLAAYVCIDIDFDHATKSYRGESLEEEEKIAVKEFSSKDDEIMRRGHEDFSMYGRAFLAVETGYAISDKMSFYIEAYKNLKSRKYIDAYNNFYLYFESNYNLPFKTKNAIDSLLANNNFVSALSGVVADPENSARMQKMCFKSLSEQPLNFNALVKDIVMLRGFLRHNSMSNPVRWDPTKQNKYREEASFLGQVAFADAHEYSTKITFEEPYTSKFLEQAKDRNFMTQIRAVLTIREDEHIREVGLDLSFPTTVINAALSHTALQKILERFNHISPGADLFAIRARVHPNGPELFRYDLGPSLSR